MGLWYWITAEFEALGWYSVYHGPEFWLVAPEILCVITMLIIFVAWRRK